VIRWATRNGAELMGRSHELGSVREGYLADLLVVDGDPLGDIGVLQDQARILAVMKGGTLVKDGLADLADLADLAALGVSPRAEDAATLPP
jgi:imidazolonepropionase-like amidohydrolase